VGVRASALAKVSVWDMADCGEAHPQSLGMNLGWWGCHHSSLFVGKRHGEDPTNESSHHRARGAWDLRGDCWGFGGNPQNWT
jgi:hypothetical protein